jgi:hypothetical protein
MRHQIFKGFIMYKEPNWGTLVTKPKNQAGCGFFHNFLKTPICVLIHYKGQSHTCMWDSIKVGFILCTYFIYECLKGLICRTQLKHGSIFCTSVVVKGGSIEILFQDMVG